MPSYSPLGPIYKNKTKKYIVITKENGLPISK